MGLDHGCFLPKLCMEMARYSCYVCRVDRQFRLQEYHGRVRVRVSDVGCRRCRNLVVSVYR